MEKSVPILVLLVVLTHASFEGYEPPKCIRSCQESINETEIAFHEHNCFCDPLCHVYGDCCEDAELPSLSPKSQNPRPIFTEDSISCETSVKYNGNTYARRGIYFITKCPGSFDGDPEIKKSCEDNSSANIFLDVPVNALQTNILYKNFFCAVCNEPFHVRSVRDVWFWKAQKDCDSATGVSQDFETSLDKIVAFSNVTEKCKITYRGGADRYRQCIPYVKYCPSTWSSGVERELCHNHTDIVYYSYKKIFKNRFCAMCNGENETICYDIMANNMPGEVEGAIPFSLLLDFNDDSIAYAMSGSKRRKSCRDGEMYDPTTSICRIVVSPEKQAKQQIADNNDKMGDCAMVKYNPGEYEILTNKSALIIEAQIVYSDEDYKIRNQSLYICRDAMTTENQTLSHLHSVHWKVRGIITNVGLIISLVCLSICIFAHFVFPALRNVPGKCVIGLSFSVFVGQLLFLTTLDISNHGACYAFAVILHYAFLASFCWMNCLSFDICYGFSRTMSGRGNERKQYIRYSMYAWGTPLLFVLIAIILQETLEHDNKFRPNYAQRLCWINNGKALLILFAMPLAIILICNVIFFSITVRNIFITKKYGTFASRKQNKHTVKVIDLVLYVKLSVIMGLTWIFGFIAALSKCEVLWYFFDIFNTLQGVLLCVSFVLTKRVWKLARERRSSFNTSSSFFRSFKSSGKVTPSKNEHTMSSMKTTTANEDSGSLSSNSQ